MLINLFKKILSYFGEIWFLWTFSLSLNIITFLLIYFKILPSGKILALHYNVLSGVDWYGGGKNILLLPAVGLSLGLGNFILFKAQSGYPGFLKLLPPLVTLTVQLIILAAVIFLARVN